MSKKLMLALKPQKKSLIIEKGKKNIIRKKEARKISISKDVGKNEVFDVISLNYVKVIDDGDEIPKNHL